MHPPARAVRVGPVAVPRVRPLAEVLATTAPAPAPPPPVVTADHTHLEQDLRPTAMRLLTAVVEVIDGRRPSAHLDAVTDPAVRAVLAAPRQRQTPPGRLRGLRLCAVSGDAVEVAAVVGRGDRATALAARLERGPDRPWRLTALMLPARDRPSGA